ncbi:hydroxymethylbilane synthase [Pseudoramibacter sp.]|jgi:hydroxymethylbilane synthase|uniref:hydroxymethylbilane synthase n=1 Tax=Pseudoramibacter sp. TaxID=2034862 RepID=UPI0025D8451F|nr:hydroxymethylbilane synthase [Pseudoramibacter sp.]MCH4072208.1 hydroxymethylbilane synthase [Pseudoramibacter sp.]MCH4105978.1 hydroxymethylbilane synthase [Pseudoramibacter sp.]
MDKKCVRVGTRGSQLALTQTKWVIAQLREACPEYDFELKVIRTRGDADQKRPLDQIGGKGLFTKEIEDELLSGQIQMAVHSMKDMPAQLPEGLTLLPPPAREDPSDVLVTHEDIWGIEELREGAVIGTGSKRRAFQIRQLRPDIQCVNIRGNIDTRLRKLDEQHLDGIVLAAAGMKRLGVYNQENYNILTLEPSDFICAPAQGILALEAREDNMAVRKMAEQIADRTAAIQMKAERAFLVALNGDCHLPIGAYCDINQKGRLTLHGIYGDASGAHIAMASVMGNCCEAETLGVDLAKQLKGEVEG